MISGLASCANRMVSLRAARANGPSPFDRISHTSDMDHDGRPIDHLVLSCFEEISLVIDSNQVTAPNGVEALTECIQPTSTRVVKSAAALIQVTTIWVVHQSWVLR